MLSSSTMYSVLCLQLVLALFELSGACVTLYLRQEVYVRELSALVVVMTISFTMKGSIFKNFLKVIDFSLVLTFILGIWFVITVSVLSGVSSTSYCVTAALSTMPPSDAHSNISLLLAGPHPFHVHCPASALKA